MHSAHVERPSLHNGISGCALNHVNMFMLRPVSDSAEYAHEHGKGSTTGLPSGGPGLAVPCECGSG